MDFVVNENTDFDDRKRDVAAILIKDNTVFIPRRSNFLNINPNMYEFPCGKVNNGETQYEALERHLNTNLSINIDISNVLSFENNIIETDDNVLTFLVNDWTNEISLNEKIYNKILQLDFEEFKKHEDLLESHKEVLPYVIKYLT